MGKLELNSRQIKAFCDALTSAFPQYGDLEMLVRYTLDEKLADIAAPSGMPKVAFALVTWAESRGRLDELLAGALEQNPTSPALLGFAQEIARARDGGPTGTGSALEQDVLTIPLRRWTPELLSPAALLRAEFGVVPFHGREDDLADLGRWCRRPDSIAARLYTGMGGMGKTRLMIEMCTRLQAEGWLAGFVDAKRGPRTVEAWSSLYRAGRPVFAVLDYAETGGDAILGPMLDAFTGTGPGIARVILLARAAGDWWDELKERRGAVGDVLSGPASRWLPMRPLALDATARAAAYQHALANFAGTLGQTAPSPDSIDLDDASYDRVLLIHRWALAAVEGVPVKEENGILDYVLRRERRFWRERCSAVGLDPILVAGIGQAVALLTLGGGAASRDAAVEILGRVPLLTGQPLAVLDAIAGVLHDALPGNAWIEPLQPDILGEHLVEHELDRSEHAGALLDLVFGPADVG